MAQQTYYVEYLILQSNREVAIAGIGTGRFTIFSDQPNPLPSVEEIEHYRRDALKNLPNGSNILITLIQPVRSINDS